MYTPNTYQGILRWGSCSKFFLFQFFPPSPRGVYRRDGSWLQFCFGRELKRDEFFVILWVYIFFWKTCQENLLKSLLNVKIAALEKNDWNFWVFLLIPRWLFSKMRGLDGNIFLLNSLTENEVRENLYFLELIRKGDVNKDFIRWKELRSNLVCFEIWFSIFAKNWWKYILQSFKRSNFSFIRNCFVSWDAWFFFPFSRLKKKRKQKFYHVRR